MQTARTGFTLVEVLVALTLSALVLALSQRILTVLMDGDAALGRTAHRAAIAAEGLRQGRVLAARALPLTPEGRPFIGATDAAEFDSLCESGRGGFTRCRVTIRLTEDQATIAVGGQSPLPLPVPVGPAALQYQQRSARGASWASAWGRSLAMPSALRIVTPSDTLDFPMAVGR